MSPRLLSALLLIGTVLNSMAIGGERRLAEEVLADSESFASQIETQIRRPDGAQGEVLRALASDLSGASEWRFYSRDRGILIAIPVKRNLLYANKQAGEAAIIDLVERLIRQRDLSGRINVVFIEPASLDCYIRTPRPRGDVVSVGASDCNCP